MKTQIIRIRFDFLIVLSYLLIILVIWPLSLKTSVSIVFLNFLFINYIPAFKMDILHIVPIEEHVDLVNIKSKYDSTANGGKCEESTALSSIRTTR